MGVQEFQSCTDKQKTERERFLDSQCSTSKTMQRLMNVECKAESNKNVLWS